jgi:subtilisin family serine protease
MHRHVPFVGFDPVNPMCASETRQGCESGSEGSENAMEIQGRRTSRHEGGSGGLFGLTDRYLFGLLMAAWMGLSGPFTHLEAAETRLNGRVLQIRLDAKMEPDVAHTAAAADGLATAEKAITVGLIPCAEGTRPGAPGQKGVPGAPSFASESRSPRLPRSGLRPPAERRRRNYQAAKDKSQLPSFEIVRGVLGTQKRQAAKPEPIDREIQTRLSRLANLRGMRGPSGGALPTARSLAPRSRVADPSLTGIAGVTGIDAAAKAAPWTADHLLADPTHMNDEHVSLQVSPVSGDLYAVFEATDLGGIDRDIHIARSTNGGAAWQVWEMPSSSLDEYHPELAIDGAGYLHVCWIVDDGTVIAIRSDNPEDPVNWIEEYGLVVGDPCAIPCIAVSGAGQFSTTFVAACWWAFNYDFYQYEYTLVWFYSLNGGATFDYDYFLPDGYQDLWPDVELDGGTAYLVNAEQDFNTGELEILIDSDAVSGAFVSPMLLSDWTSMDCGFPSLAADGSRVHCAFQLDYDDGTGTIDGDIIYCFSWDGLTNVFGPYELVADPYESVGPAIFTNDGIVGCVWLDAPAGGDEFDLASRQAGFDGHPDFWGAIETVTDQNTVDPTFRAAAGAVAGSKLHAAWIDRRDFPTQGLNVYTSERTLSPNLAPYAPAGWELPLVANMIPGERQNGPLGANKETYVSFAFTNLGLHDATRDFFVSLTVDGQPLGMWLVEGGLPLGTYVAIEDFEIIVGAGTHTLAFTVDVDNDVIESDETDNVDSAPYEFIAGDPELRVTPDPVIHVFPAPAKAQESAAADVYLHSLIRTPPCHDELQLPVIDARLAEAIACPDSDDLLRVMIVPAHRVDTPALASALQGASKASRRLVVAEALRWHIAAFHEAIAPLTRDLVRQGEMSEPIELWLCGMLSARLSPMAVRELASQPEVGRLWLDDRLSEPYGAVAAASSTAADADGSLADAAWQKALAWHLAAIGADQAWAAGYDGAGVIVGHLDSGVAYDHPDLAGHVWNGGTAYPHHGYDTLDEDDDPYDGDTSYWHGTHTAGLIVGDGTGGTATGSAPGATLMIVRCVPGYLEDLVQGLQFCLDHGAQVISMSAGWGEPDSALREANRANAEVLLAVGIPWVCAVGNGDNMGGHYPVPCDIASPADAPHPWFGTAGHSAVISVGATTTANQPYSGSSLGPTAWSVAGDYGFDDYPYPPGLGKPDLAAPGANVTSTTMPSGYVAYTGSSMSAPLVAGACAILMQANASLLAADLGELLESTALDIAVAGRDNQTGAGLLDISAALASLPSTDAEFVWIHNDGPLPLVVDAVSWQAPWLEISPTSCAVAAGDSVRLAAVFDPTGHGEGVYVDDVALTSNDPGSPYHLPVKMIIGDVVAVTDPEQTPAAIRSGLVAYPNPFNPRTVLRFELGRAGAVRLYVYDLRGRLIRELISGRLPEGRHEVVWDGLDEGGRPVGSGTYLVRLVRPGGERSSRKLALLR